MTRTIQIDNPKIATMVKEKDELVKSGIAISKDIEKLEIKIEKQNNIEREFTNKVTPEIQKLIDEGDALEKELQERMTVMEKLGDEIMNQKLALIPKEHLDMHYKLRADKEKLERDRNKIGLKIQKYKDKLVPALRKILPDLLTEYEDTETVQVKNGKLSITIFSHLEEWKEKFNNRKVKAVTQASSELKETVSEPSK